jgi:hypothetical protein
MKDKKFIQASISAVKILCAQKKNNEAYRMLTSILKEYEIKDYLDSNSYIDILMIYRDLCYSFKNYSLARATEDEIISILFPKVHGQIDYLTLDPTKSYDPDFAESVLDILISTHTNKNVFAIASASMAKNLTQNKEPAVNKTSPRFNKNGIAGRVFGWAVVAAVLAVFFCWEPLYVTYNDVMLDSQIVKIADSSGFNQKGKFLFYSNNPELVGPDSLNEVCPNDSETSIEFGCFVPKNKKIYILRSQDPNFDDIMYVTAAHEMLHAAWQGLAKSERDDVATRLNLALGSGANSTKLREKISQYPKDKSVIDSELHSFAGSEFIGIHDDYFKKYFTDINLPYSNKNNYDTKIAAKLSSIDQKSAQLDALANELNTFKNKYIYPFERGYYLSTNDYNNYKNNIDTANQKVNFYNQRLKEYNKEIEDAQKFFDSFLPQQKRKVKGSAI